ncbi:hypothetical protein H1D32_11600 [Anaerobacillus sp. CMMVII]|uniref:hypothetical protein n=1 Tax=Anaerobacillus sp. CMMVII TaxID=2755588 RepID=UPI0021B7E664|nr:hypothetical protein [Anaerobacillus sp. CMMVII]MCT8138337.1 hypothetical protein [Anaerobacillus sp. CMMVII]
MFSKHRFGGFVVLLMIVVATIIFTKSNEKGIGYVFNNLTKFETSTIPFDENITFQLTSEQILQGIDKPIKIATIYNTEVDITEIFERKNGLTNKTEILLTIRFHHHFQAPEGKMLSLIRLNENHTFTTGLVHAKVHNDKQEPISFGTGADYDNSYHQYTLYFEQDELDNSKELFFEIEGLHLLTYKEK